MNKDGWPTTQTRVRDDGKGSKLTGVVLANLERLQLMGERRSSKVISTVASNGCATRSVQAC